MFGTGLISGGLLGTSLAGFETAVSDYNFNSFAGSFINCFLSYFYFCFN